jgi:beta-lactamase regulating signal transducer with metallopeptidase domain
MVVYISITIINYICCLDYISEDMKAIKRQYLKELDVVAQKFKSQTESDNISKSNKPKNTTYNSKKESREINKENIVSQLKGKKGIGALLLVIFVICLLIYIFFINIIFLFLFVRVCSDKYITNTYNKDH